MKFKSKIEIRIGNPYVLVSKARSQKLKPGWRKPMPVLVRINGQPAKAWKINMIPVGDGSFYLYLHGIVRKASSTKVDDSVSVELSFDDSYRNGPMHSMPAWFKGPLSKNAKAKKAWDALTPSRQKEIIRYFSWLKSPEARSRNLAKAMGVLSGKPGRFMARPWKNGN